MHGFHATGRRPVIAAAAAMALFALSAPAGAQEVDLRCAPFGSIMYTVGNAVQDLAQKHHESLRVVNAEGPGSTAVTLNMLDGGGWAESVGCTSLLDYVYARQGIEPFFDEAHPEVDEDVLVLFNGFYGAVGILTTDPSIETAEDLDGRSLALGRRAQAHWGGLPALFFERGMPDVAPQMEFMGTAPSHEALPEGRADAVISQLVVSPDGSKVYKPGVVSQLFATGNELHLVGFPDEAFERAAEGGLNFRAIEISQASVPEAASDRTVNWIFAPAAISVHKDFPEEMAYELTKLMIDHAEELPDYDATFNVIASGEGLLGDWTDAELHPGAARAFREAGLID